jgi:hypothetical protein
MMNVKALETNKQSWEEVAERQPAIMQQFRISTYINTLIDNGFKIE